MPHVDAWGHQMEANRAHRAAPAQPALRSSAPVPVPAPTVAPVVPLPRPHDGAVTVPGHGRTLLRQVRRVQEEAVRHNRTSVLVAMSVGNATEIADVLGAEVLGTVTSVLAQRMLGLAHEVHLLAVSPLGGALAAIVCDRADRATLGDAVQEVCAGFVTTTHARVWPVVTVGLRGLDGQAPERALEEARRTVFDTDRRSPGGVRWFDPEGAEHPAARALSLTGDLAETLGRPDEQLSLAYQPVRDLRTGRITAVEALLRWRHPVHGPVAPTDAIAVAEASGLIHPLGQWVLDRALRQASAWWRSHRYVTVHVNVSPVELRSSAYAAAVARALSLHDLPPTALLLELTETDLMIGDREVRRTLEDLRALGVRLGIDDFGAGWSSIGQLLDLPVDTVKVDRSLVARIDHSPADLDLLRAVLGLLETAPVEVVVEGVENEAQAAILRTLSVRLVQGYHLGRPVPAHELSLGGGSGAAGRVG